MLSSISWQQFLAVISFLILAYYLYVGIRYYPKEIRAIGDRKPVTGTPASPVPAASVRIMGAVKSDHGISISDDSDLQFAVDEEPEMTNSLTEQAAVTDTAAGKPTEDLVKDVAQLVDAFKGIDDKPEFLSLLRIQYGFYQSEASLIDWPVVQQRTLQLVRNELSFEVVQADVRFEEQFTS